MTRIRSTIIASFLAMGCGARGGLDIGGSAGDTGADASLFDSGAADDDAMLDTSIDDTAAILDSTFPFPEDGAIPGDAIAPPADAFGDSVPPPDGAPAPGCPATLPAAGTTCSVTSECLYRGCNPTAADRARCEGGRWVVAAAACTSICPAGIPPTDSACTVDPAYLCLWDNGCPEDAIGQCRDGKWQVKRGPITDTCPIPYCTGPIVSGAACSPPSYSCLLETCGHTAYVTCDEGKWYLGGWASCEAGPDCPPTAPAINTPCPLSPAKCAYKNACGSTDSYFCSGTWREIPGKCAPVGCPAALPSDGSACSGTATCAFPIGGGCEVDCRCDAGHWLCRQPPCGDDGK